MQPMWGKSPGLEKRLAELTEIVEQMETQSQKRYGRRLGLAVLPEMAVTGPPIGDVMGVAIPLKGPMQDTFAEKARQHGTYIVAPLYLLENKATKLCSNAAVLFGRRGEVEGIYRKVHLIVDKKTGVMGNGCTPGKEVTMSDCGFGKLGIQICWDMHFNSGWGELAQKGADIVAWPSASPERAWPAARALDSHYYIVSSTWRTDAAVFSPVGKIVSQVTSKPSTYATTQNLHDRSLGKNILVQEIDLSYAILPWSPNLENGMIFARAYGGKVGFRYYEDEDRGIFWSNDADITIRQMAEHLNQMEDQVLT